MILDYAAKCCYTTSVEWSGMPFGVKVALGVCVALCGVPGALCIWCV